MGIFKALGVVVGAGIAIIAAPAVMAGAAVVGTATLAAGAMVGTAAAAAGTAVAGSVVGSAVIGAATTAGTAIATSAVGTAAIGAVSTAGTIAAATGTTIAATGSAIMGSSIGTAVVGAATTVGSTVASSTIGSAVISSATAIGAQGFVAGGIGASLTYSGITTVEGIQNNEEASRKIQEAESRFRDQEKIYAKTQKKCIREMEKLLDKKVKVYSEDIDYGIKLISLIKMPTLTKTKIDEERPEFLFTSSELNEMKIIVNDAKVIASQFTKTGQIIVGSTFGTLALVSQLGIASTGSAISTLSGIAAHNATIAALGGGAIAAGGGGMALGTAVLGGLAIAPASIVASWNFAKQSEKNLTEATRHYANVLVEVEKMISVDAFVKDAVLPRIDEIYNVISELNEVYKDKVLVDLKNICDKYMQNDEKVIYQKFSNEEKEIVKLAVYATRKLKSLISLKLFDDMGNIRNEVDQELSFIKSDLKQEGEYE